MPRAFLIVMDSVGCGGAPDAAAFGDEGANTLAHIAQACANGQANDGREGPLRLPTMDRMGLGAAARLASGDPTPGLEAEPSGLWGAATEASNGKDTPSGHWEIAGRPVPFDWTYFPQSRPSFPIELSAKIAQFAGTQGVLGDLHASGTQIIASLGAQHIETGWPIVYTSADSVVQIAAHETQFGLDRLLELCEAIAPMTHDMRVGRVIARPFVGDIERGFERTTNRKDYAMEPPETLLCDWVSAADQRVWAIGKIGDIFSMRGIEQVQKGTDAVLATHLMNAVAHAPDGTLVFANFVEFDSLYGHRRDVAGYARHLEWFDGVVTQATASLRADDLFLITADHGNDPTWAGTDHTRERVPIIGPKGTAIGHRAFVDIAASVADHLNVPAEGSGASFL